MPSRVRLLPWSFGALLCASACGTGGGAGFGGEVGTYDGDAGESFGPAIEGGGASTLAAHIEQNHVTVTFVTLSCAGLCADVEAVATGGNPPYSYAWEDGSTSAERHVCPSSSTSYLATVTDTAIPGELGRPAQSARAPLTANVLACPDGGTPGDAGSDLACLSNPSFEGVAANDAVNAPPWVACGNQATIVNPSLPLPAQPLLQPTDGNTALFLRATEGVPPPGAVSEPLCAPMHAGVQYPLTLDIASTPESTFAGTAPPEGLQIWGGSSSCAEGELLWSSPLGGASWTHDCATLLPTTEVTYLTLVAYQAADAGPALALGNLQADHMVPVAVCP
jgi:hypothetical protein